MSERLDSPGARSSTAREKSLGELETGVESSRTASDLAAAAGGLQDLDVEVVDLNSRYENLTRVGGGGMGEVFKAIDRRLKRAVAIKRVRGDLAHHPQALARFLTEARAVAALNHFNIVQVYDYGRTVEGPFLVMEYVDGDSLEKRLKAGPLPVEEALDLAGQICDGLARAHSQGIIHRDIKPANILLASGGAFKLSDFGLARQQGADRGQTHTGAVLGTLDFMPPEQRIDASRADARSDLWSLAATLYQALTGKRPQLMKLAHLPGELQPLLEKALEEDPADRFQTAAEFRKALRDVEGRLRKPAARLALKIGQCPQCEVVNDAARRFCLNCGTGLRQPCPACGKEAVAWEPFCGHCGKNIPQEVEKLLADTAAQRQSVEQLRSEFRHAEAIPILESLVANEHPALAPVRDWAAALKPAMQEELKAQKANRDSLLAEARQRFEAHDDAQALKFLEGIPAPLRNEAALELSRAATARRDEVQELLREIKADVAAKQYDSLLAKVNRLLQLRPADRSGLKLREQLQQRENRLKEKQEAKVEQARGLLEAGDPAAAIAFLEALPAGELPDSGFHVLQEARVERAKGLLNAGDPAAAIAALEAIPGELPQSGRRLLNAARRTRLLKAGGQLAETVREKTGAGVGRALAVFGRWSPRTGALAGAGAALVLFAIFAAWNYFRDTGGGRQSNRQASANAGFVPADVKKPVETSVGSQLPPEAVAAPVSPAPPPQRQQNVHQTATSNYDGTTAGQTRDDNGLDLKLMWCPAGSFKMGGDVDVTLTRGFWLGETEVTQGQWYALMRTKPWDGKVLIKEGDDYPATYISHGDSGGSVEADSAVLFCEKLTEQEHQAGRLPANWKYALPTEAQWEYACRAGTPAEWAYSFGNDESLMREYAWFENNAEKAGEEYAHQVRLKKPNPWGLRDMHGNVWEWCADWYKTSLPGGTDPVVLSWGSIRVSRGGSWDYSASNCRSAVRGRDSPDDRSFILGFRVAGVPSSQ